jgi:hypothetical protein
MLKRFALLAVLLLAGAQAAFATQATLTWSLTTTQPFTGFQIQRCAGTSCTPVDLAGATTAATTLTYVDTTVQANQTYCYAVVTLNSTQRALPSTPACGAIFSVPPAATSLVITFQ